MNKESHSIINHMLSNDAFSRWMGIEVLESEPGYCKLSMTIRKEMTNGFGVCHGGITFSFADSALAFASNSRGPISLALENNINFTKKVSVGDILTAETEELQNGRTIGVYKVSISNQNDELVAEFRGTVYRTGKSHSIE
ncbi:MAG: hydroxyphenylacetyl-CoA thioesterase PaaI [Gracilimonas sp.]|uniref:hydroxyphenylacetyl-CoA thioesterase PaaI n=1 Tax=Gracilimonas sp. TaxID=1974203 RepID=UPI0019CB1DE0|nr:hydroxyphenylacetyl-CoA thioesterase PaaI [Gracilimonas sp.]MBD3616728.1 hydroxyphenylacetyl-CoA thioesterase PaaI [Gracilimonas sp.]